MKIAILGDTHFGARNDSPHFARFFEKFYKEIFFPCLEKHNIIHVIQLGDVFDRRKYVNFQTLNTARSYFFDHLNQHYTSWMLVGNHDVYYKNTNEVNSLELLLSDYHNINVVNQPTLVEFDGCDMMLIPWICDGNQQEIMEAIKQTPAQVLCGHLELTGFEMYRGQVMDHGMNPDLFRKFEMVVSGHYHHKSRGRNVVYTGTPYEMTWSDYNDVKGFHIFDTETRELEFISNPFTLFHKMHYDDTDKDLSYLASFNVEELEGCFVKLIVRSKNNPFWFDNLVDRLEKAGVVDLQVVEDHFNLDIEADDDIINEAEDTMTIFKKYVDTTEMTVDKTKLNVLLRSLYEEALSLE